MTFPREADAEVGALQAALRWHAAAKRGDCDWDAFTAWLEADAAHQQAYAHVAELERQLENHRPALQPESVQAMSRRRGVWPAAVAAALLLALGLISNWDRLPFRAPPAQEYTAQSGESPVVLASGARITLSAGSRMRVSGSHQDHVDLTGSAYFDVPHDPRRTLVVVAGGYTVRDIGTRFEVFGTRDVLKVAVAEGSVNVDLPGADRVRVEAGQRLLVSGTPPRAEYASIVADDVAGWREGRLIIRDEPLSLVAAQISLHAGRAVTVDAAIAQRRFSGVLAIGDGSQLAARLGEIMGLVVQPRGDSLHLAAADTGH